ncbi:hypothetical protein HB761_14055 [Vibrio campbellii]|uniref:Uncharacterized protein n=1 Tax=Vibrio campbellii TaxID=680 RepID=A0AAE9MZK2_9VIBR|nr:hypothetical protein [Vibrio campbellii]UTZ27770.1 hypothetical protein HB761_14055 [Vibrio campbellii]
MNIDEKISQRAIDSGGRLRVKSALNPILWLCGLITIPCISAMAYMEAPAPMWLVLLAFIPVCCAAIGFLFLLIMDRDKLQSEDYQSRKQSLELIQQKGDALPISSASIQSIANPTYDALPQKNANEGQV